jgi:hypothetical protein
MTHRPWWALVALLAITLTAAQTSAGDSAAKRGLAIAKKMDKANSGYKGEYTKVEMLLVNARGDEITRKLEGRAMETKSDGDRSIIQFNWPADVKGTRLLTWTHKKGHDDQWMYLPAVNRTKRISSRNKSGSFMGSEFSYEDLGSQEVEKYEWKYLGDETLGGTKTWKLSRTPTEKRSGYSKQVLWVDTEILNPIKIKYYDRKGDLLKTAKFAYAKYGDFHRAKSIAMKNHQTRKRSVLTWQTRKVGKSYSSEDFESDSLED